jgi:hypothetical protein
LSEKERVKFMKKSSELGTTSDLVVVHTLICSLWGVTTIGLRIKTKPTPSFIVDGHLFCSSASFHFLEKSTQMPLLAYLEPDSQRIIHQFEALKLSSYSLKSKLISANAEEILAG